MILNANQILALAPDSASAKAGSQLGVSAKWSQLGRSDTALWGECQGSGKNPYRTQIDLSEPAFKCSCPSRKFPCKHGLGLYLLLDAQPALFGAAQEPQWVQDWLLSRQARLEKKMEKAAQKAEDDPQAEVVASTQARKREEKREEKVARGMDELQRWLHDLAREGIASVRSRGQGFWDAMSARLVDAQAGALAKRIKRAGNLCYQPADSDWERRLGSELASVYLLAKAWQRIDHLPPNLQADVRTLIGWSSSQDEVLAQAAVEDRWQVLAQVTSDEDRLRVRSTWLRGASSMRWVLVLQYVAGNQGFEQALAVGTEFDGELCFYPSAYPLRAVIRRQSAQALISAAPLEPPGFDAALDAYSAALSVQPFLERFPLVLGGVVPDSGRRALRDAEGRAIPLHPSFRHALHLLALSGGRPVTLVGEWDGRSILPLSVWHADRLYSVESDLIA